MITVLAIGYIVVSVFLILLVLIQDPKGGATGGMFGGGGGSNSLLGATGTSSFLAKLTKGVAITFSVMCIVLTIALKPTDTGVSGKFATESVLTNEATEKVKEEATTAPAPVEKNEKSLETKEKSSSNSK